MSATPSTRLVAEGARLVTTRSLAVTAGLAGRLHAPVHVAWPDLSGPSLLTPPAAVGPNRWLRDTFQPESRLPPGIGAATWVAMRAGGAIIGGRPGLAARLAQQVLDRELAGPHVTVWSASADRGAKSNAFVWERGADVPALVVKLLPDVRRAHRLQREAEMIATVRARLAGHPEVAVVLPVAALHAGEFGGVFLTAEPLDPLGGAPAEDPRDRADRWLADLQRSTATPGRWTAEDTRAARDKVARGWPLLRPGGAAAVAARTAALLAELEGLAVPHCVEHGDLWRGNIAIRGASMRVYDWEWARLDQPPFFDLWTYDLAEHRHEALHGRGRVRSLDDMLADVEAALRALEVDVRFALATLAPALIELTFRSRWQDDIPSGSEEGSIPLMQLVERCLDGA